MTLKGVNADWAKAHQCAHVRTHSLQRAQTGFTADAGIFTVAPFSPSPLSLSFSFPLNPPLLSFLCRVSSIVEHCLGLYVQCNVLWPHMSHLYRLFKTKPLQSLFVLSFNKTFNLDATSVPDQTSLQVVLSASAGSGGGNILISCSSVLTDGSPELLESCWGKPYCSSRERQRDL